MNTQHLVYTGLETIDASSTMNKFIMVMLSGQVRSGNLISPAEPLAGGYFVAPSKEKRMYKLKLKIKVELINIIMQKSV